MFITDFLHSLAENSALILELVGIIIIMSGSFRTLIELFRRIIKKQPIHVASSLGRALALALEFKMGSEIIKTVIIHNLEELAILGVVIIIRALLSVIIHWEIRLEEKSETDPIKSDK